MINEELIAYLRYLKTNNDDWTHKTYNRDGYIAFFIKSTPMYYKIEFISKRYEALCD